MTDTPEARADAVDTPSGASAKRRRTATLIGFTLATAAEYWTSSGVSLVLTDLTGTLSASSDEASWVLTVYTTAFALSIALSHRLSSYLGNRRYLTLCASLYAFSSLGCCLTTQLSVFLLFRVLQGFGGGAFLVRAFVFLSEQYDAKSRGRALTSYGIGFFFVGKLLSPVVCGWMTDVVSWRFVFAFDTLLALGQQACFIATPATVGHQTPSRSASTG